MAWNDDMVADAAEFVAEFGRSRTYRKVVKGAMNTTTGKRAETTTDTTITMHRTKPEMLTEFGDGSRRRGRRCTFQMTAAALAAASITPDTNDRIVDSDLAVWQVEELEHRMDGALVVLTCRRTES
jgi:hypothetical protein